MSQRVNETPPSLLVRLIGEDVRDWRFKTETTLIRFGGAEGEVVDPRLAQVAAQITLHQGHWWVQVAGQTTLQMSPTGRASDLAPCGGSGLLKTDRPNLISLNQCVFRVEFTETPGEAPQQSGESQASQEAGPSSKRKSTF